MACSTSTCAPYVKVASPQCYGSHHICGCNVQRRGTGMACGRTSEEQGRGVVLHMLQAERTRTRWRFGRMPVASRQSSSRR
jgi:hypothetical protein